MKKAAAGIWVGLTVSFLLASLAMVQLRCKVTGGYPCGDWPRDGYTWQFWPAFLLLLLVWAATAAVWTRRAGRSFWRGVEAHGEAASPMLGLVVAWAWYGLTGPQFHPPACTTPVLCHVPCPGAWPSGACRGCCGARGASFRCG